MAGVKGVKPHKWSEEEKKFFMEIVPGRHYDEILELMNARFDYQFKKVAIIRCSQKVRSENRF